jgi:hypothetical protein
MSKLVGFVLAIAAGCASQGGGTTGGGEVTPRTGVWSYSGLRLVNNTCNQQLSQGENGNFLIDTASTTSLHIDPNDGYDPFSCALSDGAFDCPNRIAKTEDERPSLDAVFTLHVDVNGTFDSASHGTGTQQATVDCVGSQCSVAGTLPCHFEQDFVITAQ